ncbi:MAG: hypothetical protein J6Q89_08780 [Clostridia bacterium]|nr:hypothetical protein [Clostridia bacterium]
MKLTYEILENGYKIKNNGKDWIVQLEPCIPDKTKSYEDNAKAQIEEILNPPTPEPNEIDVLKEEVLNTQLALTEVYEMLLGGAQ